MQKYQLLPHITCYAANAALLLHHYVIESNGAYVPVILHLEVYYAYLVVMHQCGAI